MPRDHSFVDVDDIVVVPRQPTRRERELERWHTFGVLPLRDETIERIGHPLHSVYVERFWLPIVGPSTLCMARNLLARTPGAQVTLELLGSELGLNENVTLRTIDRLLRFGFALHTERSLLMRTHVAPLSLHQFGKLPAHLRIAHSDFVEPAK